jgi:hypothetical protein
MNIMNYNKVETNPNKDQMINTSDYFGDLYTSSELSYSQHGIYKKSIKSSSQALIDESKNLVAQAEKLMSKGTTRKK